MDLGVYVDASLIGVLDLLRELFDRLVDATEHKFQVFKPLLLLRFLTGLCLINRVLCTGLRLNRPNVTFEHIDLVSGVAALKLQTRELALSREARLVDACESKAQLLHLLAQTHFPFFKLNLTHFLLIFYNNYKLGSFKLKKRRNVGILNFRPPTLPS